MALRMDMTVLEQHAVCGGRGENMHKVMSNSNTKLMMGHRQEKIAAAHSDGGGSPGEMEGMWTVQWWYTRKDGRNVDKAGKGTWDGGW